MICSASWTHTLGHAHTHTFTVEENRQRDQTMCFQSQTSVVTSCRATAQNFSRVFFWCTFIPMSAYESTHYLISLICCDSFFVSQSSLWIKELSRWRFIDASNGKSCKMNQFCCLWIQCSKSCDPLYLLAVCSGCTHAGSIKQGTNTARVEGSVPCEAQWGQNNKKTSCVFYCRWLLNLPLFFSLFFVSETTVCFSAFLVDRFYIEMN